uniref:Uncharacterized protein n=1 Tax=Branchiostoma floridae TaxID=7739 RepID=C3Y651_BRAFL|eukprot:XP_002608438.1 hypothetical protein BRAFLDRAFT_96576 [Branchiostoma floridae]
MARRRAGKTRKNRRGKGHRGKDWDWDPYMYDDDDYDFDDYDCYVYESSGLSTLLALFYIIQLTSRPPTRWERLKWWLEDSWEWVMSVAFGRDPRSYYQDKMVGSRSGNVRLAKMVLIVLNFFGWILNETDDNLLDIVTNGYQWPISDTIDLIQQKGCLLPLKLALARHTYTLAGLCMGIAILQVVNLTIAAIMVVRLRTKPPQRNANGTVLYHNRSHPDISMTVSPKSVQPPRRNYGNNSYERPTAKNVGSIPAVMVKGVRNYRQRDLSITEPYGQKRRC